MCRWGWKASGISPHPGNLQWQAAFLGKQLWISSWGSLQIWKTAVWRAAWWPEEGLPWNVRRALCP